MNDWQVVLPYICPQWVLEGFIESMGDTAIPLLLVDNSIDSHTTQMDLPGNIEVVHHPKNLGVAASWNLGLRRGARWTLVCSACIRFLDGLDEFIDGASKVADSYGLHIYSDIPAPPPPPTYHPGTISWHLKVIGRATVDAIGTFDENFYPADYEDNDYGHRMTLAKIAQCLPRYNGKVICVANTLSGQCINRRRYDYAAPGRYFCKKWGGTPGGRAVWTYPFNDKTKGLDYWPEYITGEGRGPEW